MYIAKILVFGGNAKRIGVKQKICPVSRSVQYTNRPIYALSLCVLPSSSYITAFVSIPVIELFMHVECGCKISPTQLPHGGMPLNTFNSHLIQFGTYFSGATCANAPREKFSVFVAPLNTNLLLHFNTVENVTCNYWL